MTAKAHTRFVVLFGVVVGAIAALAPACSLDWQVRADPGDGGLPESRPADVIVAETATDAPDDAPDATEDADECVTLGAAVMSARAKAKECVFNTPGACKTTIKDECDCDFVVSAAGSAADMKYASAVAAFLAKPCPPMPACGACPQLGSMVAWTCLGIGTCSPL